MVVQKRNKNRVNVYLDGEFALGLAAIEAARLRKGQHLSVKDIARLKKLDLQEVVYERALTFLAHRPRSEWEVKRRLKKAMPDLETEQLEQVVHHLRRVDLLDDAEFARYWVSNREQFKPRSKRALRYELRQKGIDDTQIEDALETVNEDEAAMRAALSRVSGISGLDRKTFAKRLGDFLARRGFNYDTARSVIDELWAEQAAAHQSEQDDLDAVPGENN
jgi:regulatory protein